MKISKRYFLVALFGLSIFASGLANAQLIEDFDGGGNTTFSLTNSSGGAPMVMAGGPTGSFVRLANLTASNNNSIAFDVNASVSGPMPGGFVLQFDFRMSDDAANTGAGGCCGSAADGLGISIAGTATYGAAGPVNPTVVGGGNWEVPTFGDAFSIGLDVFSAIDVVNVNWNGGQVAQMNVQPFLDLNSGLFHRATVTVSPSGANALVDMTIVEDVFGAATPETVFTGLSIPGMNLSSLPASRLIAGGRTGGAFHEGDFDNISLTGVALIAPLEIPTLGVWAMVAFVLLLLVTGWWANQRMSRQF